MTMRKKKPSCIQAACRGGMIKSNYRYLQSSEIPQVATYELGSASSASSDSRARVTHGIQGTGGPGLLLCPRGLNGPLRLRVRRREYLHGDNDGRNQIRERHPDPHQAPAHSWSCKRRQTEQLRCRQIEGIDRSITKHQESGKNVTRQRGKEEVQSHGPPRRPCRTRRRLHDGPPKQKAS